MNEEILYLRTLTPMHVGSGNDAFVVDMPIQREKLTQFPKIDSSGLKGCFSRLFEKKLREKYFGNNNQAGEISILDAKLLFFPIQSQKGLFALATCPMIIKRYIEEVKIENNLNSLITELGNKFFLGDKDICVFTDNLLLEGKYVVLADYLLNANKNNLQFDLNKIKDIPYLDKIAVLSDDVFCDLVSSQTEISTRNKIDDKTGTTDDQGLFTEEYLPAESIMYIKVIEYNSIFNKNTNDTNLNKVCSYLRNKEVQIGGNRTLGKGIIKII